MTSKVHEEVQAEIQSVGISIQKNPYKESQTYISI